MNFDVNTIRRITEGGPTVNGENYHCIEFVTNNDHVRILCVEYPNGCIYETYYDPYKEEYRHAVNRLLPVPRVIGW